MWRTSKEEWQRRKSYLIRSLFEDLPVSSPIYESQEPTQSSSDNDIHRPESPLPVSSSIYESQEPTQSSSDNDIHRPESPLPVSSSIYESQEPTQSSSDNDIHRPESPLPVSSPIYESQEPTQSSSDNDIHRPESPLPDLIIEKEPPREIKYHQDEPEEFYDKLAREMRKRYKRDFLHVEKDSTTSSDTTYEIRNESYTQIYETQKTMSTSSDNDTTESEVICSYEQITCEALVHANYEEITDQPLLEMIHASEGGADPRDMRKIIEMSEKDSKNLQEEGIGLTENESFANLIEANQKSFSPKSPDEFQLTPEITRRRQTLLPDDALSTPKSSKIRRSKIFNKSTSRLVPYSLSSSGSSTQKSKC